MLFLGIKVKRVGGRGGGLLGVRGTQVRLYYDKKSAYLRV